MYVLGVSFSEPERSEAWDYIVFFMLITINWFIIFIITGRLFITIFSIHFRGIIILKIFNFQFLNALKCRRASSDFLIRLFLKVFSLV